jgi:hypothetical protein
MRPRRIRIAQGELEPLVERTRRTPRPKSGRRTSKLRYTLIAAAFVAVGTLVVAVTNLHLMLDSDEIGGWITTRVSAVLSRPIALGRADLSVWPRPSVRLTDVEVGNLADFDGPTLARVETARLDVAWLPLVVGRVHVRRLLLEGVQLQMAVAADGESNFGDLVPSGSEPPRPLPDAVSLRIHEVSLSDGSLTFFDAHAGRSLVISGVDAEAVLSPTSEGGWRSTLAARSDSLLMRIDGAREHVRRGAGPSAVVLAHGGGDTGGITVDEGHLEFGRDTLAVYGVVSLGPTEPGFDLLLTGESFSAGFLASLFPTHLRPELLPHGEGSMRVMVQLHGGADSPPTLRGSARLRDVGLRLRGEPFVDRVSGLVRLTPDTIAIDSLAGRFAGGPFELSGTIVRGDGGTAFVARAEPDLDVLDDLGLLPAGTTVSGDADLYVSVVGSSTSFDSVEAVGVATFSELRLVHPRLGVALHLPSGDISLVGREVRWSEVTVLLDQDRVLTSGSVSDPFALRPGAGRHPLVELSIAAARLDLSRIIPASDTASTATYAQLALAHLGGRMVDQRAAPEIAAARGMARPQRLPAVGSVDLSLDTLVLRQHIIGGVSARLELQDSVVHVPELSFEAWDGRATASLHLGVGPNRAEPFALTLSVVDARAEQFLAAMSPVGDAVSGTLDLHLDVSGATDVALLPLREGLEGVLDVTIGSGAVGGTGVNLALADFLGDESWTDVVFRDWSLDIDIADHVLDIREARLDGESLEAVVSGPLGLDGSVDLSLGLTIPPERLRGLSLRRTGIGQSVLDRLRAAGGSLELGLRLTGWLQAPTLEPDASHEVAQVR